jgi:hypothetical protein
MTTLPQIQGFPALFNSKMSAPESEDNFILPQDVEGILISFITNISVLRSPETGATSNSIIQVKLTYHQSMLLAPLTFLKRALMM